MMSAEASVKDGVADTSTEYIAAGKAAGATWTLTAHVDRIDYPVATLPDGSTEEGYTTYRLELEACQVATGRVESLSREILPDDAPSDIAEMVALLVRPEGIANADTPWLRAGVTRPKPRPKPPLPKPPEPPPPPPEPKKPAAPRAIYGERAPFSIGASVGVSNALVRPDGARGPSWAMPIGGVIGYALPDALPGLELKGNLTGQVVGPRAVEVSAGARYAVAPIRGVDVFVGPELLVGVHVATGADTAARFLTHGALFLAVAITDNVQVEAAADLAVAAGGAGTLLLGGGTARLVLRF